MESQSDKNSLIDFSYSSPHPNFDRSQVYGYAATLFTVKDKKVKFKNILKTIKIKKNDKKWRKNYKINHKIIF